MPDDISEANELDFFTYFYKVRLRCSVTSTALLSLTRETQFLLHCTRSF